MQEENDLWNLPSDNGRLQPIVGRGSSIGHHGEIFQGVYVNSANQLQRGLVSLMSPLLRAETVFYPTSTPGITVNPSWKIKAARAAQLTLEHCDVGGSGGRLFIRNNIPPSWGLGSSTSDVTATIRAVADAFGQTLAPRVVAELAVKSEIASDSIMYTDRAVLFAQRAGLVLEEFSQQLPPLEVLGFNTDPAGYETLSAPPARYDWWEIEAFRPLIGLLRKAVETQDTKLVGRVASASARINQRHLPKPNFDYLDKLTDNIEAVGLQVAHSGTIVGLLFDPADVNLEEKITEAKEHLTEIGITFSWRLYVNPDPCEQRPWPFALMPHEQSQHSLQVAVSH